MSAEVFKQAGQFIAAGIKENPPSKRTPVLLQSMQPTMWILLITVCSAHLDLMQTHQPCKHEFWPLPAQGSAQGSGASKGVKTGLRGKYGGEDSGSTGVSMGCDHCQCCLALCTDISKTQCQ